MFKEKLAICSLILVFVSVSPESQTAKANDVTAAIEREFIYETAPFPSCHASTIVETSDGHLVVAFFGGQDEKHPDVGIWLSRLDNGNWSAPVEVANGIQYTKIDGTPYRHPCWNPVLHQPKNGPLMLFYKVGPSPDTWWGMLMTSDDQGATWSTAMRLPEHIDGPVKNKPFELADGTILCPSSTEFDGWRIHMEWTADLGRTWHRTEPLNDGQAIGAIQPSILTLGPNQLLALGRTRQGKLFRITSSDQGQSWSSMTLMDLPNPNSGTDAVTLKDGRHLLVYNPTSQGRTPLNVAISSDGVTWNDVAVLENSPGEYSYPAIIETNDNLVHITYTWKRERIRHVVLDPSTLSHITQ